MASVSQLFPLAVFAVIVISIVRSVMRVTGRLEPRPPARPAPDNSDPEVAERTRRIQEEIRRKIAERRGETVPSENPGSETGLEAPLAPVPAVPQADPLLMNDMAMVLERQRRLADQMRALEAARLREQQWASVAVATVRAETDRAAALVATREGIFAGLRDPQTLRQVMVLREVLGPPVGLR